MFLVYFSLVAGDMPTECVYRDDEFFLNIYGSFQSTKTWTENATLTWKVDCGSHCEMWGYPPGETPSGSMSFNFCETHDIMQPTGRDNRDSPCPPVDGWALATTYMAIVSWVLVQPVSLAVVLDNRSY